MSRVLVILLGIVAAILLLLGLGFGALQTLTQAPVQGALTLPGLRAPVEVLREPDGVIHIQAQNLHDLFFAQGFVQAEERLFEMDFQRRLGEGTLAAVVGPAALKTDEFFRTLGVARAAREAYQHLPAESRAVLKAYAEGVNAYLQGHYPLPLAFRLLGYSPAPWRPVDSLVWAKMMSWELSSGYSQQLEDYELLAKGLSRERIRTLFPPYPSDAPTILQPDDLHLPARPSAASQAPRLSPNPLEARQVAELLALGTQAPLAPRASNNWVVSGSRTATGLPLLANDPHLTLLAPSLWILMDLEAPHFHAIGASFAGVPGIVIGHNRDIGWGVTNVGAENEQLYILKTNPQGTAYEYRGQEISFTFRTEVFDVKGKPPVKLEVRESLYGPVISDVVKVPGAEPLALRWTSLNPVDDTLTAFLKIDQAKNWQEFRQALRYYVAPSQNFVYADTQGNIGYFAPGLIPIRQPGDHGRYPDPGNGAWDWKGYIPFDELPQTLNPPEGFIASANNKVVGSEYPYRITPFWSEPYRAERIVQLLQRNSRVSVKYMERIQLDQKDLTFPLFQPFLAELTPSTPEGRSWQAKLLSWDGVASPTSRRATLYEAWLTQLETLTRSSTGIAYLTQPRFLLHALAQGDPACGGSCLPFATQAFDQVLARLRQQYGKIPPWGEVHRLHIDNPILGKSPLGFLYNRDLPYGGTPYTVNVGHFTPSNFVMHTGPSFREILNFANLNDSLFALPGGASENPLSSHYENLLPLWLHGKYITIPTQGYPVADRLILKP